MKVFSGNRVIGPPFLNLVNRWRIVVKYMSRSVHPLERAHPLNMDLDDPQSLSEPCGEIYLNPAGIGTPDRRVLSPITVSAMLSLLSVVK